MRLPLARGSTRIGEAEQQLPGGIVAQKKVLIIDDEKLLVKSTCMALKYQGFETEGALDGPLGLDAAANSAPDIILLDIMMPGMDGWQVLEKLKKQESTRGIPVVVFTAREQANGTALARERGAVDYVTKPFDMEELSEVLRKHLG